VIAFFENDENVTTINRLKKYGVQLEIIEKTNPNATSILNGKTFVVSGVFSLFSRDELKQSIEDNGGKVGSSISTKTNFVIAGENMGPAKLDKANQLKIPIISENEYVNLLKNGIE
jgi:DNA ligase (NAD+)